MYIYGLDCAPFFMALLILLLIPLGAENIQVREIKGITYPQQVHSLDQDLPLDRQGLTSCSDSGS